MLTNDEIKLISEGEGQNKQVVEDIVKRVTDDPLGNANSLLGQMEDFKKLDDVPRYNPRYNMYHFLATLSTELLKNNNGSVDKDKETIFQSAPKKGYCNLNNLKAIERRSINKLDVLILRVLQCARKLVAKEQAIDDFLRLIGLSWGIFGEKKDGSYHVVSDDHLRSALKNFADELIKIDSNLKFPIIGWLQENGFEDESKNLALSVWQIPDDIKCKSAAICIAKYHWNNNWDELKEESRIPLYSFTFYLRAIASITKVLSDVNLPVKNYIPPSFAMLRGAKKEGKQCQILDVDTSNTGLTLHQRQSLFERIVDGTACLKESQKNGINPVETTDNYNHLVVNIGFIVTNCAHKQGGKHDRIFHTMALRIDNQDKVTAGSWGIHTEPLLFDKLKDETILKTIVKQFADEFKIQEGFKFYGAVLDCHSMYDMCIDCQEYTKSFYNDWRPLVLKVLEEKGFVVPSIKFDTKDKKYRQNFNIIIRFSSNSSYKNSREKIQNSNERDQVIKLDKTNINLLLFGDESWYGLWYKPDDERPLATASTIPIEKSWTLFGTSNCGASSYTFPEEDSINLKQYGLWNEQDKSGGDSATKRLASTPSPV